MMVKKKGRPGPLLGQCLAQPLPLPSPLAGPLRWLACLDEIEHLATGTLHGPGMPCKGEALLPQLLAAPMWDATPVPFPTTKPTPLGKLDVL